MKLIKPDFENSVLNISSSLAKFLGKENNYKTLSTLDESLAKGKKNVVFLILDGCGINPININLSEDCFLRRNIRQTLTSVFPSTTTNATTTYRTALPPIEHGWFGWSVYFEGLGRAVDVYMGRDSYTGEEIDKNFVSSTLPTKSFYADVKSEYEINRVVPSYFKDEIKSNLFAFNGLEEMFSQIKNVCEKEGKQFVYAYCPEPDSTMHEYGVSSAQAKKLIEYLNSNIERLVEQCKDTLFIVSADHGQVDIDGYVEMYKDKTLLSFMQWPFYLEPRAIGFKIKEGKEEEFEKYFSSTYGDNFVLFRTKQLLEENYFGGRGDYEKMLGDYIGVCYTHKQALFKEDSHRFKGHHTSLTEEMEVPLIIVET